MSVLCPMPCQGMQACVLQVLHNMSLLNAGIAHANSCSCVKSCDESSSTPLLHPPTLLVFSTSLPFHAAQFPSIPCKGTGLTSSRMECTCAKVPNLWEPALRWHITDQPMCRTESLIRRLTPIHDGVTETLLRTAAPLLLFALNSALHTVLVRS